MKQFNQSCSAVAFGRNASAGLGSKKNKHGSDLLTLPFYDVIGDCIEQENFTPDLIFEISFKLKQFVLYRLLNLTDVLHSGQK
jgi:hypothetical protein